MTHLSPSARSTFPSSRNFSLWLGLALAALFASAAQAQSASDFQYTKSNGQLTITGYTGSVADVVIPAKIHGVPVTALAGSAFVEASYVTGVTIPAGITSIDIYAITAAQGLTSITVSAQNPAYSSLNGVLFNKARTTLIKLPSRRATNTYAIPGSVTKIGEFAFEACAKLSSVTIPNSVTSIEDNAFYGCGNLGSITIPDSVTAIGSAAFAYCGSLTTISVSAQNPVFSTVNGVLFDKNQTTLVKCPVGKTGNSYTIPSGVTTIGESAFNSCFNLHSVTIPNSVTTIGDNAFENCTYLNALVLPDSITSIGSNAFSYCFGLSTFNIPRAVTSIGSEAFAYCRDMTSITASSLNSGYRSVDGVLFNKGRTLLIAYPAGKTDTNYTIPSGVTTIGDNAFAGSGTSPYANASFNVTIPRSVTTIGNNAFNLGFSTNQIIFLGSAPKAGQNAFVGQIILYYYQGATGFTTPTWTDSSGDTYSFFNLGSKVAPAMTSPTTASGIYQAFFYYTIEATGLPSAFQAMGLPPGLSLDPTTGGISGIPTVIGIFKVTLGATDSYGTGTALLTLTINKVAQTITFPAIATKPYGSPLTLKASSSSGLPVTFTVTSGPATVSGNTLTLTGLGVVTVKASQAGNAQYFPAADVSERFRVQPGQTITFPAVPSGTVGQTITLTATSTSGLPITYLVAPGGNYLDDGAATLSGSNLTFTHAGRIVITAEQAGNADFLPAAQIRQNVAIVGPQKIVFVGEAFGTVGQTIALQAYSVTSSLRVTYSIIPTAGYKGTATLSGANLTLTSPGKIKIAANQSGNGYYLPTQVSQVVRILALHTITFPTVVSATVGQTLTLTATATTDSPIYYSIIPTSGYTGTATISGSNITFTGAGKIKIAADQYGTKDYPPETQAEQSVTIAAAAP